MFYPKTEPTSTFNIAFIGKYYAHYALCPTLLFAALQQLIEDRQVDDHDVRVLFYTNEAGQKAFALLAKQYNIEQIVSTNEYILRSELVKKMHQSSILMILTTPSKDNGTHGIMGTKFYEILGVEKPCLCLNSDEECLAESIKQTNAGLAATNTEDVKAFVLEKYQEWKQNGYTHQQVINKEQFTRQHEAKQFEKLFIEIMKH